METTKVAKIIRELHNQIGGAIPMNDIMERAKEDGLTEDQVNSSLETLTDDGIISRLDEETIEFL